MQLYVDIYLHIYLLLNYSTCFGHPLHQIVRSVPQPATAVLCTPDDGHDGCPKHVE